MSQDPHFDEQTTAEPATAGSGELARELLRLTRVAQYRQGTILWVLAGCVTLGAAYYALAPRYYRSEARLMVIEQGGDEMRSMAEQIGGDNVMATQRELVRSPVVLQRAIQRLTPEHRIDLEGLPPAEWVRDVADRLSTSTVRKTNLVNVSYRSLHPEAAAAVVRSVIESYLEFVEEAHRGVAADLLDNLTADRDQLERDLAEKQLELSRSREQIGRLTLPDREDVVDPIVARALRMNDALMTAQEQRVKLQASLATVRAAAARGEDLRQHLGVVQQAVGEKMMLSALGLGEDDLAVAAEQRSRVLELQAELDRVEPFLGPAHPTVATLNRQIANTQQFLATRGGAGRLENLGGDELGPLLEQMLAQSIARVSENERQLQVSFDEARTNAAQQSGEIVRLQMLDREVQRLERYYDVLFEKISAVDIRQVSAPMRATIVQQPLPDPKPASPRLKVALGGSLLMGLVLGLAVAYLQDTLDDRFGSPDEIAMQLGCRVLALVRKLPVRGNAGLANVQMHADAQAVESEAFRTLRTAIALGAEVSERLVITSSEPSDGKTTISSNLAVAYAQTGKRTLVIDSDLRKPGLTALLGLKGQAGMTDILSAEGDVERIAERCLQRTDLEQLDVIPAGPRRPDPADLLLGPNFAELLAWADGRYDQVLIDCPPVLAVSDAQIVARLVDGVVLVLTPEKNHRRLVARACESVRATGTPLLGVVPNRISDQAHGYGYGYGYGYGHDEEGEGEAEPTPLPRAA
ncbi:MAG: polysaccharide biosynthesis tyrosine autokinase [Planctomycetota bacterium]